VSADGFVSLAEAAAHKRVHYQTVRKAIARGDLKATKVGAGVIITLADLHEWQPKYKHAPRCRQVETDDRRPSQKDTPEASVSRDHDD